MSFHGTHCLLLDVCDKIKSAYSYPISEEGHAAVAYPSNPTWFRGRRALLQRDWRTQTALHRKRLLETAADKHFERMQEVASIPYAARQHSCQTPGPRDNPVQYKVVI